MEIGKETKEEMGKKQEERRGERRERDKKCVASFSVEAFDIFSQGRDLETCGGLSLGRTS